MKKDLQSSKLLKEMKKPTMEVGDGEKVKGTRGKFLLRRLERQL